MSSLPSYVTAAKAVPWTARAPWFKTIAPTYAGIMLWFVFWQDLGNGGMREAGHPGGVLAVGPFPALLGLALSAVICHFFFYMAPAMLGVKTGLPLYVVGASTYGARGSLIMPGFLMGLLQFGWLAVNAWAVARILCSCFNLGLAPSPSGGMEAHVPGLWHGIIAAVFAVAAALVGLKGIRYVARVATYLPLIPVLVLIVLLVNTWSGLGGFNVEKVVNARSPAELAGLDENPEKAADMSPWTLPLKFWAVVGVMCTYVVGFFATAGAAATDVAAHSRNDEDVHIGGVTGVVLPTVLAGAAVLLILVGVYGSLDLNHPENVGNMIQPDNWGKLNPVDLMPDILGPRIANIALIGLAISSFPGACFSSFIGASSFKTTMPKVNPYLSVGIGTLVAVALAVSGVAGNVIGVFQVIGASFGPVCGAMLADYLLAGRRWLGPRAAFNPAGWISWLAGFVVGTFNLAVWTAISHHWQWAYRLAPDLADWWNYVPVPPVAAMVVGFVLYLVLSLIGLRTRRLEAPNTEVGAIVQQERAAPSKSATPLLVACCALVGGGAAIIAASGTMLVAGCAVLGGLVGGLIGLVIDKFAKE